MDRLSEEKGHAPDLADCGESSASPAHPIGDPLERLSASALEEAARACREWETVREWRKLADVTDHEAVVSWRFGSSTPAYKAVVREASQLIGENLGKLISEALDRIEDRARRNLDKALSGPQGTEVSPTPAAEVHEKS